MSDETQFKEKFAKLLLKTPNDPFKAALALFPDNTNLALRVAHEWPNDEQVKGFQLQLAEDGFDPLNKQEVKVEVVNALRDIVKDERSSNEDKIKAAKGIGELMGLIERPQTNINNNVQNVSNRVMVIRESESNEDWETKLRSQQDKLTNASTH